jgi:2-polyprenyl-3-methyl-5-hydroxy-6-metoxy-1,4-benzoquinol methylase
VTGLIPQDRSHGYEAFCEEFIARRTRSAIGAATVGSWAESLPPGGDIVDLGCGAGVPNTRMLVDSGFSLYGVDTSPGMVAEFRARIPGVPVECASVEDSQFFGRMFDGVVAWGLLFFLRPIEQVDLTRCSWQRTWRRLTKLRTKERTITFCPATGKQTGLAEQVA